MDILDQLLTAIPNDPVRFAQLCKTVDDWDGILNWAVYHNVESVVRQYLIERGLRLPPATEERLHRWQNIKDLWQAHAQSALTEALAALDSASVHTVALKGPILAERLYPNPSMRSSADLDLLVSASDLDRAIAALRTIGYGTTRDSEARFLRKYHYHIILSRACPPVIELHFRLTDSFGVETRAEEFLSRAKSYSRGHGPVASILSPEDEMLYLCIHAAGHRFLRLSWLYDIKLLLLRHPNLDWGTLTNRARSLRLLASLVFTCETLHSRFGVNTPLGRAVHQRLRSRLANLLLAATARQPDPSRRFLLGKIAFMATLCDRPSGALKFLQRQLLLITRRRAHRHFPYLTPEEWSY